MGAGSPSFEMFLKNIARDNKGIAEILGPKATATFSAIGGTVQGLSEIAGAFAAAQAADDQADIIEIIAANRRRQQSREAAAFRGRAVINAAAGGGNVNRGSNAGLQNQNLYEAVRQMSWEQMLADYRAEQIRMDAKAERIAGIIGAVGTTASAFSVFATLPGPISGVASTNQGLAPRVSGQGHFVGVDRA